MSHPFFDETFTFTQPDGSTFQVRGWGDQHEATFETLDGYRVVKDPLSGFYHYAAITEEGIEPSGVRVGMVDPRSMGLRRTSEMARERAAGELPALPVTPSGGLPRSMTRWQTRREHTRMAARIAEETRGAVRIPPSRQTVGAMVGLCLLIDFPDEPATITREEVEAYCNQPGYTGYGNNGSVYDYFDDVSGGNFQFTNIVAPYYTARRRKSYYTNPNVTYPLRAQQLIQEALTSLRSQGFDFSRLTVDNGNYVYAMSVFYAGNVVNNWSEGLWPHAYHLPRRVAVASGKYLYDYQITNMGQELTLGTFCHENGHMACDFPDLYDYAADGEKSFGAGVYCLMAAGANANRKNPAQVSAYLKFKAGWAREVTPITGALNATLQAGVNDFYLYRLNNTEYYIIENRLKAGRDQALTDSGLAIWHVDELGNNEHGAMEADLHYECALVQADNRFHLEQPLPLGNWGDSQDLFEAGVNNRFDDTTAPSSKWWSGAASRLSLSNISRSGPSMSFTASTGTNGDATGTTTHDQNGDEGSAAKWTFMIYIAGDNDLESFGATDLGEMQQVGSSRDVQIVAQFDSLSDHSTRRFHLKANSSLENDCVEVLPEVNMGDPNALYAFVEWAVQHYPAEHYALVLWNHGSGWKDDDIYRIARARGVSRSVANGLVRSVGRRKVRRALFSSTVETLVDAMLRAIAFDDTDADFLDSVEMRNVLVRAANLIGRPLDLLGFDACLMSMLEVFYQVRNGCGVAVGSQELEPGDGWPYHLVLDALVRDPAMSAEQLATTIVDRYMESYRALNPAPAVTQSAARMAALRPVAEAVSHLGHYFATNLGERDIRAQLGDAIRYAQSFYDTDYLDLVDFCQILAENDPNGPTGDTARAVLAAFGSAESPLIVSRNSGGSVARANGLSIYLPTRKLSALYQNLDFAAEWQWDNFLSASFTRPQPRPLPQ